MKGKQEDFARWFSEASNKDYRPVIKPQTTEKAKTQLQEILQPEPIKIGRVYASDFHNLYKPEFV